MHSLADVADDARCGGKARGLAKLIKAGLPVPPGIVIDSRAFASFVGTIPRDAPVGRQDHELHVADSNDQHDFAHRVAALADAEMPPALLDEVHRQLAALSLTGEAQFAVRSSATIEDAAAGAGAGLFSSVTRVRAEHLTAAIKAVWHSAIAASVAAYARRREASVEIAVIVMPFVVGELVTVYTRPPGAPTTDEVLVQRGSSLERLPRSSPEPVVQLALRAEAAIGAMGGADVEIIQRVSTDHSDAVGGSSAISFKQRLNGSDPAANEPGSGDAGDLSAISPEQRSDDVQTLFKPDRGGAPLVLVQARPIVHPKARARMPLPPPMLAGIVADGRTWTWDVTHNPDPLSVAQSEIVERVERAGVAPYSLRTVSGYLYSAPRDAAPEPSVSDVLAQAAEMEARIIDALGLATHYKDGLHYADDDKPTLDEAMARYLAFYKIWAYELAPLISAARRQLVRDGRDSRGARPSSIDAILMSAARGEIEFFDVMKRIGEAAPAWDVAVSTYREKPRLILDAVRRARELRVPHLRLTETTVPTGPAYPFGTTEGPITAARRARAIDKAGDEQGTSADIVADLAERDDHWFAHAQWLMRRTLQRRGRELGLDDNDAFWIPFDELTSGIDAESARRKAAGARAAMARAAQWDPPLVVNGEKEAPTATGSTRELRGIASGSGGGKASGRVVKYASLASAVMAKPGDVIVARAITPALAVMVIGCAAIVSETGGVLDHGAAMARELGIPCVVGCRDAWRLLENGALVEVDGDAGTVSLR